MTVNPKDPASAKCLEVEAACILPLLSTSENLGIMQAEALRVRKSLRPRHAWIHHYSYILGGAGGPSAELKPGTKSGKRLIGWYWLFFRFQELQDPIQLRFLSVSRIHDIGGNFLNRGLQLFTQVLNRIKTLLDSFKAIPNIFLHLYSP
jgi:hypothetical protein